MRLVAFMMSKGVFVLVAVDNKDMANSLHEHCLDECQRARDLGFLSTSWDLARVGRNDSAPNWSDSEFWHVHVESIVK